MSETYHFDSIDEIRATNRNAGQHFFDEDTLRFFGSRIHDEVYRGRYFITSEKGPSGGRLFTIRKANTNGTISTKGDFQGYGNHQDAEWAIRNSDWGEES